MYDLEELVLTIRNKLSKNYMLEALSAYQIGALNASVCSIWIAVAYDILTKIREISSQGDNSAIQFITTLDNAIENKKIQTLMRIEENLLETALKEFEFISPHEYSDLKRLKDDRNFCAHPAFVSEDILFKPTKELVRSHIVHSIVHLLRHQPVQGKSAIKGAMDLIKSTSFPDDPIKIKTVIGTKYLNKSKDSFIRNFATILLKSLIKNNDQELKGKEDKIIYILEAILTDHKLLFESLLQEKFDAIIDNIDGEYLLNCHILTNSNIIYWKYLSAANKIRLEQVLSTIILSDSPADIFVRCKFFSHNSPSEISSKLIGIFGALDAKDQVKTISLIPNPIFNEWAIKLFKSAGSYRSAEYLGRSIILPLTKSFTKEQIVAVLLAFSENDQIQYASGSRAILEEFFDITASYVEELKTEWLELYNKLRKDQDEGSIWAYSGLMKKLIKIGFIDKPESLSVDIVEKWQDLINYVKERKVWMAQDLSRCTPEIDSKNRLVLKFTNAEDAALLKQQANVVFLKTLINTFAQFEYDIIFG